MKSPKPVDKAAGRIGRKLKVIYERVDFTIEDAKKQYDTSCEEGCDHCCYLSPAMSIPEGLAILDVLSRDPNRWWWFQQKIKQLLGWVRILEDRQTTRESWFDAKIPCLFLRDHKCTIYEVRPTACRSHISVDEPFKCSHEADRGADVRFLNLRFIDDFVWKEAQRYLDRENLPLGWAPMSVVMIWSFLYWTRGKRGFREAIKGTALADGDLANLIQWVHLSRSDPRYKEMLEDLFVDVLNK